MKQDKFLMGIVAGIGILLLAAVILFFSRKTIAPDYQSENTPQNVVLNYMLAVRQQDFSKAYGYLSDKSGKPTMTAFRQALLINQSQVEQTIIDFGIESIDNNAAIVEVITLNSNNDGIFTSSYENKENAILEQVDGKWKISSMPYLFWNYDWYQVVN